MSIKNIKNKFNIVIFFGFIFFGLFFGKGAAEAAATCTCDVKLDDKQKCTGEDQTVFPVPLARISLTQLIQGAIQNFGPDCKDGTNIRLGVILNISAAEDIVEVKDETSCGSLSHSGAINLNTTQVDYNISCSFATLQTPVSGGGSPTDCENNPLGCDTITKFKSLNKLNLTGIGGAQVLIGRAIKAMMGVIGSIALLMFVAGGFMWMTAAGNSERTAKAMRMLTWSTLGIVVIFLGYVLVKFIFSAF